MKLWPWLNFLWLPRQPCVPCLVKIPAMYSLKETKFPLRKRSKRSLGSCPLPTLGLNEKERSSAFELIRESVTPDHLDLSRDESTAGQFITDYLQPVSRSSISPVVSQSEPGGGRFRNCRDFIRWDGSWVAGGFCLRQNETPFFTVYSFDE